MPFLSCRLPSSSQVVLCRERAKSVRSSCDQETLRGARRHVHFRQYSGILRFSQGLEVGSEARKQPMACCPSQPG